MWRCPKCGRSFSHEEQGHYCGKIETVDPFCLLAIAFPFCIPDSLSFLRPGSPVRTP